jgi:glycosyltransferase involved in cell wall biosynthesis
VKVDKLGYVSNPASLRSDKDLAIDGPHIVIDARMVRASGIGTYIEQIVPRIVAQWSGARFTILGDQDVLCHLIPQSPRVAYALFEASIYSIKEQLTYRRVIPKDAALLWVPHFNVPLLYGGRLAATVHDVFHLASPEVSGPKRLYAKLLFRSVVRRAGLVMCDSAFTANELRRLAGEPRRLEIVHLGVSRRWSALPSAEPLLSGPYLLAVGNVKPHKNLQRLVAAFERVADIIPHRLVIVGRREGLLTLDTEVEQMAARLGERVLFTGHVTPDILERYVAGCAALIHPSLYEGFGLPPLEAMAAGRPVAVSRAASLPEVCGPDADYFDPTDVGSIADALRRQGRAGDDAAAAARRRAWTTQYSWDACATQATQLLMRASGNGKATT